ncbi:MAG: molecular chaperone, partial [Acidobacteria bacterium]
LILKGERQKESELGDENVYRIERQYGTFARSFTLPTQVDASKIKATYRDGILEITLPKSAEAKPKKVEIHAA